MIWSEFDHDLIGPGVRSDLESSQIAARFQSNHDQIEAGLWSDFYQIATIF